MSIVFYVKIWYNKENHNKKEVAMKYQLVVSDMDGTLLNEKRQVSEFNKKVIAELEKKGIIFTIATGRAYSSVKKTAQELGIKHPIICSNGAVVVNPLTEEVYYKKLIEKNIAHNVVDLLNELNLYYEIQTGNEIVANRASLLFAEYRLENKIFPIIVEDMHKAVDQYDVTKIILEEEPKNIAGIAEKLKEIKGITATSSLDCNIEINSEGISKAFGIKFLSEKLSIKPENMVAFGDNFNDETMLKYVGLGVAMGNADDEIKKIADNVTLNNLEGEDGVGSYISEIFDIDIYK